jgi:CxxC motif-containing protein (DUF1111 family)
MKLFPSTKDRVFLCLAAALVLSVAFAGMAQNGATEAIAGYSTPTGCPATNYPPGISPCSSNGMAEPAGDTFANDQASFEEQETIADGLGPVYNDKSCVNCHQNPVSGGISQITELRVGHTDSSGRFVNPTISINDGASSIPNRSLVNDRAICPQAQERTPGTETIATFRTSLNTLGDGYVESIDSNTLAALSNQEFNQSGGRIAGEFIQVPVLESPGQIRGGRFGWKDQQASLLSFSSDAYINEMGITNRLNATDTTSVCKTTSDPEDSTDDVGMQDIDHFAQFMRATKVPPRDTALANTFDAVTGHNLFVQIGCAICHQESLTTAPAGTVINGGAYTVPAALGSKIIHPFSDFLLHNVGTGDGIQQNGPADTANKMRTAPLWGVRSRDRLMHDGESLTRNNAILRHGGEANFVINNYRNLSTSQKNQLITFLNSL